MNDMEKIDDELAVRFLLGDLPDESRSKLEERFFQDDRFYEQLLAIQEELADDYVQDRLSQEDRARFENFFLQSPMRRERVEFAAAFSRAVTGDDTRSPATPRWWKSRMALGAVAAAVMLVIAAWLVVESRRPSEPVQQARTERDASLGTAAPDETREDRAGEDLNRDVETSSALDSEDKASEKEPETKRVQRARDPSRLPPTTVDLAILVLTPNQTRGGTEEAKLFLPVSPQSVRIQLDLEREESYASFLAELRTAQGRLAWSKTGLQMQRTSYGSAVFLTIPAGTILAGEYEVALMGETQGAAAAVGYYYFTATER